VGLGGGEGGSCARAHGDLLTPWETRGSRAWSRMSYL